MRENDLLQHVYAANAALPASVVIPPGDDMGAFVLPAYGSVGKDDRRVLVTVDQVADGVHFDLATTPLEKIGRKAITRNLSDVAAMAAQPCGAVVAVSLPRSFTQEQATRLFDAMRTTAALFDCPLLGGDISVWDGKLLISVTVFASPAQGIEPVLRTGSRPGDAIYVTGELGYSLPTGHHLDFTPRVKLAQSLAGNPATRPRAMMDLSDGLAQDLPRMVQHAEIDTSLLPMRTCENRDDKPAYHHALGDGEDYELLFTVSPAQDAAMPWHLDGVPLTRIGTVTDADGIILLTPDGHRIALDALHLGWEHHA